MRTLVASICAVLGLVLLTSTKANEPAQDKDKEYTIKVVMQEAHKKDGPMLMKKVASGKADDAEKKTLVAMYVALTKLKPPQGEADSWKEKTKALVDAAKSAAAGDKGAGKVLTKAANCKECHANHKG